MKRFFSKSLALLLFSSSVSFVLTFGTAMIEYISRIQSDVGERANDQNTILVILVLVVCLLLLNTTDIIECWLRGKAQELKVKNLVGISSVNIFLPLFLNLNMLVVISFLIGTAAAFICSFLTSSVFAVGISILSCACSFLFSTIFLNLFCIIVVWHKLYNGYMEI